MEDYLNDYPSYTFGDRNYKVSQIAKVTWKGRKTLESMDASPTWTVHFTDGHTFKIDQKQYCKDNPDFDFWIDEIMFPG